MEKWKNIKFKDAVPFLDGESDNYFIVLFSTKDPDEMTLITQGDKKKVVSAVFETLKVITKEVGEERQKPSITH